MKPERAPLATSSISGKYDPFYFTSNRDQWLPKLYCTERPVEKSHLIPVEYGHLVV